MNWLESKFKYVFSLLLLLGLFAGLSPKQVEAKTSLPNWNQSTVIDNRTVIQSKYSFIPRFGRETEISWGGGTGNGHGGWREVNETATIHTKYQAFDAINNPGRAGQAYFKYSNVGEYNDKSVDLKIVINDWRMADHHSNGGNISFQKNRIALSTQGFDWVDMDWQFYESGTNKRIYVNGYFTISDIDLFQEFDIHNSTFNKVGGFYIDSMNNALWYKNLWYKNLPGSWHRFSTDFGGDVPDEVYNSKYAFTFTFSGDSLRFRWGTDWSRIKQRDDIFGKNQFDGPRYTDRNRAIGEYFMYSEIKPAPFGPPRVDKSVNRSNLRHPHTTTRDITYDIDFHVPSETNRTYHKTFTITDDIDPALDIESVKVYQGNTDVTRYFNMSTSGNKVRADTKSNILNQSYFYDRDYRMVIKTRPNMRYLDNVFEDRTLNNYNIPNRASIATDRGVSDSGRVNTNIEAPVYYDLTIYHRDEDNGTVIKKETMEFLEFDTFTATSYNNLNTRYTRPSGDTVYGYKPLNPKSISVDMTRDRNVTFYYRVPKLEVEPGGIDIYTDQSGKDTSQPVDIYVNKSVIDQGSSRGPKDSVNDFVGGKIKLSIFDVTNNRSVWSDVKDVVGLKDKYSFDIPNDYIGQGKQTKYRYSVEIDDIGDNNYELVTKRPSIETTGYSASEVDIIRSGDFLDDNDNFKYSSVILTEARHDKVLEEHEEHVLVHKIYQPKLKSGYGYEFAPRIEYSVESKKIYDRVQGRVSSEIETKPQMRIDEEVVDLSDPYIKGDNVVISLDEDEEFDKGSSYTKDLAYHLPKAYLSKKDGRIRYDDKNDSSLYTGGKSSIIDYDQHVDAGRKMYVPIWIETLGDYNATLEHTQRIGSNQIGLSIDNVIDVYAFMFSHVDSITPDEYQDELLLHPMDKDDELFDKFQ